MWQKQSNPARKTKRSRIWPKDFWPPQILQCPKYTISGRRRICSTRNTLFLAVADFATLEIHYFWPPQILQRSKYTISGRRRFCNARNTLFLAVADFTMLEIHYFWPSQILQCPKYIISGRRRIYNARNTLFLAVADFAAPEIHYFWLSQILQCLKYTISGRRGFATTRRYVRRPPAQDNAQLATVSLSVGISCPTWDRRPGGWRTAVRDRCR